MKEQQSAEDIFDEKDDLHPEDEKYLKKLEKNRIKRERNARIKEVKKALLGNLVLGDDNRLTPGEDFYISQWGTPDGAFGTRLFGIAKKEREYRMVSHNVQQIIYNATNSMKEYGRGIDFETVDEGAGCLIKHIIFRPVVLIFEKDDEDVFSLKSYCGRDVLCYLSMRRAIKLFEQTLPAGLELIEKENTGGI